ncbi:PIR Superfamily Protein [Plasmodium ovale curtisi]|uniref:PIR Superfamily Protein n=1 Tax=Plasmodium ovale curtisi TaxID=864141 RepID=A0A1A8VNK3_PLAOA|nr:PIR Superfamily Protein [Plasmodium ovale curtisi]
MSYTGQDIYTFYKDFKEYEQYAFKVEDDFSKSKHDTTCNSFLPSVKISNSEKTNDICAKFKYLHSLIYKIRESRNESLNGKDFTYLNYWLNSKLRNNAVGPSITVNVFLEKLNIHESEFCVSGKFNGKLYDLEDEDFQNMNLLSSLQVHHSEIFSEISRHKEGKISCLRQYKDLLDTYRKCINKCHIDNVNFCNALIIYKEKYKEIYGHGSISGNCNDEDLLKLPTYKDISLEYCASLKKEDKKNIVIDTILVPTFATLFILIFLYAFTPLGKLVRRKIGKNKVTHNNQHSKNDKFLLNTSDNEHINWDENPYSITYDSVVNS